MKSIYYSLACFVLLVGLTSCPKTVDEVAVPVRPSSNLSGRLTFLDEFHNDSISSTAVTGIAIKATNVTTAAMFDATFDAATSTYTFANLPKGRYRISYKADGFAEIVNDVVDHAGGEARILPRAYVYQPSTTVVRTLADTNLVTERSVYYDGPEIVLEPGARYTLEDTIVFIQGQGANITRVYQFFPTPAETLFVDRTTILKRLKFSSFIKEVRITATLESPNEPTATPRRQRGAQIYLSDQPNPGPTNYKYLLRTSDTFGGSNFVFNLPLQRFADVGILTTSNRNLYIRAYGLSGDKNWYGTRQNPDQPAFLIIPGINQTDGTSKSAELVLEQL